MNTISPTTALGKPARHSRFSTACWPPLWPPPPCLTAGCDKPPAPRSQEAPRQTTPREHRGPLTRCTSSAQDLAGTTRCNISGLLSLLGSTRWPGTAAESPSCQKGNSSQPGKAGTVAGWCPLPDPGTSRSHRRSTLPHQGTLSRTLPCKSDTLSALESSGRCLACTSHTVHKQPLCQRTKNKEQHNDDV